MTGVYFIAMFVCTQARALSLLLSWHAVGLATACSGERGFASLKLLLSSQILFGDFQVEMALQNGSPENMLTRKLWKMATCMFGLADFTVVYLREIRLFTILFRL
jgi:hypothetical protein